MINLTKPMTPCLKESNPLSFKVRINNVVGTVDLNQELDINYIEKNFKDVQKRIKFPGVIVSISKPKATILLFHSGKCILTGLEHPDEIDLVVNLLVQKLKKINISVSNPLIKLNNIVANGDFHTFIDLDRVILQLPSTIYEPEIFPGVIFKMSDPFCSALIFNNGKFILAGNNSLANLKQSAKNLALILKHYGCFSSNHLEASLSSPTSVDFNELLL